MSLPAVGDPQLPAVTVAHPPRPPVLAQPPAPTAAPQPSVVGGRFKKLRGRKLRKLVEHFSGDLDPLNLLDEIAFLRALVVQYVNDFELRMSALLTWHRTAKRTAIRPNEEAALDRLIGHVRNFVGADDEIRRDIATVIDLRDALIFTRENRPMAAPDVTTDIAELLDTIGRMVERIEKARAANNAISAAELNKLMNAMGRSVDLLVGDETIKAKIRDAWVTLVTK